MQFNLVNNKEILVFLCIGVHDGAVCLAVSGLRHTCTGSRRSRGLSVAAIWNHVGKSVVRPLLFFKRLFSAVVLSYFSASLPLPLRPPFFSSFHCYHSMTGAPDVPVCVGAHGWVAGIASHGSVLLSRGLLITVEAPWPWQLLNLLFKLFCSKSTIEVMNSVQIFTKSPRLVVAGIRGL